MLALAVCVGGCAPGSRAAFGGGGAALVPSSWYALPGCGSWRLPWCPFPPCLGPRSRPFLVLGWSPAGMWSLFRRSVPVSACPHLGPLRALLPEFPLGVPCPPLAPVLALPGVVVAGGAGWGGGADGTGLGVGGLEPLAEGLRGVGGAEALDRIAEEGLLCRLWHDGLRGGLVGVGRGAGAHLLEGMHYVHPIVPSRSPGPLHPAAELLQSGGRPPGEVGGGLGGGGVRARGPRAAGGGRGPAVVAGVAVPGGAGAAVAGTWELPTYPG